MTKIEWTNETWNPTTGCDKVSQGCKNCYAETVAKRFWVERKFTDVQMHEERLTIPMKWKQPKMIFVDSMSDLFHEAISFEFINHVFTVMSDVDQHIYQVLTKRPKRMLEFFEWKSKLHNFKWQPSNNVWLGVSCENQETADERIPLLLQVPAAVRFLSCEPLLGKIDLQQVKVKFLNAEFIIDVLEGTTFSKGDTQEIHWVIAGGESGHDARPMHPDWVRSLRDQCNATDVPFFFKQWGEWANGSHLNAVLNGKQNVVLNNGTTYNYTPAEHNANSHHYSAQQWAALNAVHMSKVGKSKSGSLLDGVEHKEFPKQ
jgi:protein gp37